MLWEVLLLTVVLGFVLLCLVSFEFSAWLMNFDGDFKMTSYYCGSSITFNEDRCQNELFRQPVRNSLYNMSLPKKNYLDPTGLA